MLLYASAAFAAPLAPSTLDRLGVEASVYAGSQRAWLQEIGCTGAACDAWRKDTLVGAEVTVGLARPIGLYVHGAWADENTPAARYRADGYALGGGVAARVELSRLLGVHGWLGVEHQLTAADDLTERMSGLQVDAGVVLRGGSATDGFSGWVGVGVIPWSRIAGSVVDGEVDLVLSPRFPAEAVGGFQLTSEPLFGPWNDRTRLALGAAGALGYRTSLTGFVSVIH